MCLLSSVEFLECVCRNDAMWFLYLVLNSFSVSPMYVSGVGLSQSRARTLLVSVRCVNCSLSG